MNELINTFILRKVKPEWYLAWIFYIHIRLRRRKQKILLKHRGKTKSYCGKHSKLGSALTVSYGEKLELFMHAQNSRNLYRRRSPSSAEVTLFARLRPTPERLRSATVNALLY
jgi:hypothetical protein